MKKHAYIPRYIEKAVKNDLSKKMVFIAGPRQVGKTTLARQLCVMEGADVTERYLNWDDPVDRENIMRERFPAGPGILILDEIHKFSRWRQVVKGLFDKRGKELKILVTGSARLDFYRKGGDSLQGRYYFYRLFPLSLGELPGPAERNLEKLLTYGGFPEPFTAESEIETKRWSRAFRTTIVREDLRDLEHVYQIDKIEQLAFRLPYLVGSPLSLNALREDLQVSHQSVSRWLIMLENLYYFFRIYPFGAPQIRAVKKEAKHYHWDWTVVEDRGARFENMVACHLMKWCCFLQDTEGRDIELRYFRDVDRREVDFVVVENNHPVQFIESKLKDGKVGNGLRYLKKKFPEVSATQVVFEMEKDLVTKDGVRVCGGNIFLKEFV